MILCWMLGPNPQVRRESVFGGRMPGKLLLIGAESARHLLTSRPRRCLMGPLTSTRRRNFAELRS